MVLPDSCIGGIYKTITLGNRIMDDRHKDTHRAEEGDEKLLGGLGDC